MHSSCAGRACKCRAKTKCSPALGQRVHTGKSEPINQQFAQSFTQHFAALAAKYPVYADLQNLFDLRWSSALLKSEDLPGRAELAHDLLRRSRRYPVVV